MKTQPHPPKECPPDPPEVVARRVFYTAWHTADAQAETEFPKPRADGFYNRDVNGHARCVRRWELIARNGGLTAAEEHPFMVNLKHETIDFNRTTTTEICDALGIPHKHRPTKSLVRDIWAMATKGAKP